MTAYCLFDNLEVTDPDALADYAARTLTTVEARGGRYVVIGGPSELKEGDWTPTFPVMIEFPSLALANEWYESIDYAPLKQQRQGAGRFRAVFIAGLGDGAPTESDAAEAVRS